MDVPVQYYQSVIAVELAVAGGLLFQIRFFTPRGPDDEEDLPHPWKRVLMALILGMTIFGSLASILHGAGTTAASAVTVGLALSLVPILLRTLPPLSSSGGGRHPDAPVTVVGIVLYLVVVAGAVALLNT